MEAYANPGGSYRVDEHGFLINRDDWDEGFAIAKAEEAGIAGGLTEEHWKVIGFIRDSFKREGECPAVHRTCKVNKLFLRDLKRLFPAGYLRGACKLSGITCNDRLINYYGEDLHSGPVEVPRKDKVYRVTVNGFLVEPSQWDREFAANLAHSMKIPGGLGEMHWKILDYLRETHRKTGKIPTVYETCEQNQLEFDDLERLFPDGYHRGAVRLAGLRLR